jgi:hypothetical protein
LIRRIDILRASVLNTSPSFMKTSRRITLSRVWVLPVKVIRPRKYCLSSSILTVTSTTLRSGSGFRWFPPVHWKYPTEP